MDLSECFYVGRGIQEKSPHHNCSVEKSPQEKTPQISPVEKTPQPVLQLVETSPHPLWAMWRKALNFLRSPFPTTVLRRINVFNFLKSPQFPTAVCKIYKCIELY